MKVHLIGSLLCAGLLIVATSSGAFAAEKKGQGQKAPPRASNNFNNAKSNSAGIIIATTTTNGTGEFKKKGVDSRFGGVNKDLKTAKPGGGPREPGAIHYHSSKSNTSNIAATGPRVDRMGGGGGKQPGRVSLPVTMKEYR